MAHGKWTALVGGCALALASYACSGDDTDGDGENRPPDGSTGSACEVAEDCFPDVADDALQGDAVCLDRVDAGYCTHTCSSDDDCCAAEGECPLDLNQVCSPFESTGDMMCFLSCEKEDISAVTEDPPENDAEYCQRFAGSDFICRSSGGGSSNRKVCVPGDCGVGEDCSEDADCSSDLVCITDFKGGYCSQKDCALDTDCPTDSVCVDLGSVTACLPTCSVESDCTFCRADSVAATCDTAVENTAGDTVTACLPELN